MSIIKNILTLSILGTLFVAIPADAFSLKCKCKDDVNTKNTEKTQTTFERPWGTYTVIDEGNGYLVKTITVNPKQKLSIQRHNHRAEHWIVLEGTATVIKGEKELTLKAGDSIDISVKEIHSLQNPYDTTLKILEVQKGDIIDENDIERLSDIYGRK
ncbi:MAG: phosphomannose isomerase type II C-terminal cupin domain [Candidatus Gastranaerophilales bacterium]|nr:phosphomannose isomerase type II C-terminal cupin domain [Candidatus Gastranaerophilales bacterium]